MTKPTNAKPKKTAGQTQRKTLVAARYPLVDATRGFAIVLMIAYHFCFDLNLYQIIQQDFHHSAFWLTARAFIVSLFLLLVGVSLVLAQKSSPQQRWQRLLKLAGCAALVTIGSMLMFPHSYIFFGILHFILVASLIGLIMLRFYWLNLFLGAGMIVTGLCYSSPIFDQPWLQWIGLMTYKPITEDYVPLLPWLGVVLSGIFLGKLLLAKSLLTPSAGAAKIQASKSTNQPIFSQPISGLAWLGRRSLLVYMLHQPILLAGLSAWSLLSRN